MTHSKLAIAGLLALGLAGTGAVVATAQDTSGDAPAAQERVMKADQRGGKGRHGGGHGHRQGRMSMMLQMFDTVDADGDGAVTQAEIDDFRAAKVAEVDASGDGALSIEEFEALYSEFIRERMVDAFQRLDADGDGAISSDEMDRRFGDIVERMDRDGDGALTRQDRGRRG